MESDDDLLARHVAGDPHAFAELVRRHRDRLWAVALRTLGDREEAADAVQDALISAFRSAHTFQGKAAVTTWLHRITVNACLDRARKAKTRRTAPMPEPQRLEELVEPEESAAEPAERGELRRQLQQALGELPPDQRAALVLVDMEGYPVAEAARILEAPVGTIKSRCARGRARLLPLLRHLRRPPSVLEEADSQPAGTQTTGAQHGRSQTLEPRTPKPMTPEPRTPGPRTQPSSSQGSRTQDGGAEDHTPRSGHHPSGNQTGRSPVPSPRTSDTGPTSPTRDRGREAAKGRESIDRGRQGGGGQA